MRRSPLKRLLIATTVTGLMLGALGATPALAQDTSKVGTLACDVSAGIGLILEQKQTLNCVFTPSAAGAAVDTYSARINEYGVALGALEKGYHIWGVLASVKGLPIGAFGGTYAGGGAEATAGVGGSGRAFSLQPISVEGQVGVNVAGGPGLPAPRHQFQPGVHSGGIQRRAKGHVRPGLYDGAVRLRLPAERPRLPLA